MSLPNSDAAGAGLAPATPGPAGLAPATPGPAGLAPAINGATRAARRVVLVAFAATALLVALFGAERLAFHHQSAATQEQVRQAAAVSERILLEDERLTMSANLAATTGEQRWVQRYDAHIPAIDKAIAEATALAPPDVAQRFDQATRVANDRLVEMERLALERVQGGDLAAARQMLESREYADQKAVLAAGSSHFLAELQGAVQGRLQALSERSWLLLGLVVLLAAAGFVLLWRVLVAQLVKAERAFGAQQQEVERLALHDPLTGLANRRWLAMQLAGALARAGREQQRLAVLVLDLDGFKPVNDRLGHAAGDAVLAEVARRLAAQSRQGEIVARLGGDEFVLVLGGHDADDGGEAAVRAAQRLVAQIEQPILTAQGEARISACCGVAVYPADGVDAETLIRRADVALYRAKAQGRGEVCFFQPAMDDEVRERESLLADLRQAIADGGIEPWFQPLVDMGSGRVTGFEVLARWFHPVRGEVPPAVFVPVAEDNRLIDALTLAVLRPALLAARGWDDSLTLALNIAPQQLRNEALVHTLVQELADAGVPARRLEVEITESALIGDVELARRVVLALKARGMRVALDDFGTGYSSLSHLAELPFDQIKIDRSFVSAMHRSVPCASIVKAIVGLGRSLNLHIVAEGVETGREAVALQALGCHTAQGWWYARAMPAARAAEVAARGLLVPARNAEPVLAATP